MATGRWNTSLAGWPQTCGFKPCLILKTGAAIWKKKQATTSFSLDPQPKGKGASQRWEAEWYLGGKPRQNSGGRLVPQCSGWWGTVLCSTSGKAGHTTCNLRICPWFSPNLIPRAQSMRRYWKSNHPHDPQASQHAVKLSRKQPTSLIYHDFTFWHPTKQKHMWGVFLNNKKKQKLILHFAARSVINQNCIASF